MIDHRTEMIVRAVAVSIVILACIVLTYVITSNSEPIKKFKVIDKYKGCDVIQYSPSNIAHYQYFLHCS